MRIHNPLKSIVLILIPALFCNQVWSAVPPAITSFSPESGTVGTTVTITGTNFNTTASKDFVFFGATRATVTLATATSLTVTVPAGATHSYISVTDTSTGLSCFSVKPFIPTFTDGLPQYASTFSSQQNFTTGTSPACISMGDLDGDGKADAVVTNNTANTISAFLNTSTSGTVSFAVQQTFVTGTAPNRVLIGDLDGDGKPDVAVTNQNSNTFSVFRNTSTAGTISFAAQLTFATGVGPIGIAMSDLDGDGKSDVAVANSTANTLSIFPNNSTPGNISFAAQQTFAAGTGPNTLVANDLDGDGKPDLAVSNYNSNTISVYLNTSTAGTISLGAQQTFATENTPRALVSGDFDGDGKQDLAVTNYNSNTISVFHNNSTTGSISFPAQQSIASGIQPYGIALGDLNGDAKPDIAVANRSVNSVSILYNNSSTGSITLALKHSFSVGTSPYFVEICDVDGNSRPDIATVNFGSTNFTVLRNIKFYINSAPVITSFTPVNGATGTNVTISGSDFNTDPSKDFIFFGSTKASVLSASANSLTVKVPAGATFNAISVTDTATGLTGFSKMPFIPTFNDGLPDNSISFSTQQNITSSSNLWGLALGDLDGDGKSDIITDLNSGNIGISLNTSIPGTVSFAAPLIYTTGNYPVAAIGDLDGDGKPDVVTANYGSNNITVFRNTSTPGTISFATSQSFSTGGNAPNYVTIGDLDGDGRPDVIVPNANSDNISVFQNISTPGIIILSTVQIYVAGNSPYITALGDLDGDGKPDLAVTNNQDNTISVYHNASTPGSISLATQLTFATGMRPNGLAMGDLDGDGKQDIAVANNTADNISIFHNNSTTGTITLATQQTFIAGNGPVGLCIGDLDGDRILDIAVSNQTDNTVSVYHNKSNPGSIALADMHPYPVTGSPLYLSIGDIDGDERSDIATANNTASNFSVIRNISWSIPTITSFTPAKGFNGNNVTITGKHFNAAASKNTVYFGATKAGVVSGNSTQLDVTVPAGSTNYPVTITDQDRSLTGYSNLPFVQTYPGGVPVNTSSFAARQTFAADSGAMSVFNGDLDGDGKADLVVANITGDNISLYLNTSTPGNISLAAQLKIAAGNGARSARAGDLDGDGKLDIALVNQNANTISVFRNTSTPGNLSFAAQQTFATGTSPFDVAIRDIDGDGLADLVVTNQGNNSISALRNTSTPGTISFAVRVNFTAGIAPYSLTTGDVTGDGKPDVIITNQTSNNISVFPNTSACGSISFATRQNFIVIKNPRNLSVGDIDGDGKLDIAVTNFDTNIVSVFRNTSVAGTLSLSAQQKIITDKQSRGVSIGDLDGDGKPDLAIANFASNKVSVYHSTSVTDSISFSGIQSFATDSGTYTVSIGDLDGDGKPDMVTPNNIKHNISVFRNTNGMPVIFSVTPDKGPAGTTVTITGKNFDTAATRNIVYFGTTKATVTSSSPTVLTMKVPSGAAYNALSVTDTSKGLTGFSKLPFTPTYPGGYPLDSNSFAPQQTYAAGLQPYGVSKADFDGDGKTDIAVANYQSNSVTVHRNTSITGTISIATQKTFAAGSGPFYVCTGDFDGDGKTDIAVANFNSKDISVLRNTSVPGNVTFAAHQDFSIGASSGPTCISAGDLDGDGKTDLAIANFTTDSVSVLHNNSTHGNISFNNLQSFAAESGPYNLTIGDLDGDGKADITVTNQSSNNISVLLNNSTYGSISFAAKQSFATGTLPYCVALGDLDGDGKTDVTVANKTSNTISVLHNNSIAGSLAFAAQTALTTGTGPESICLSDMNGDGKTDLAVIFDGVGNGFVSVYQNTSSESITFAAGQVFKTGSNPKGVAINDLDGDGRPDLITANMNSTNISVLRNVNGIPVIFSYAPASAGTGMTVTINGNYLTETSLVNFGATPASSHTVVSQKQITAVVAAGSTGNITVTSPYGSGSKSGFTYLLPQTISFSPLGSTTYGTADFSPGATASSTLAITYTSSDTTVATIESGKIHIKGAGTCTIYANQSGNAAYVAAAEVSQSLTITKAPLTIANLSALNKSYDGTTKATLKGGKLIGIFGSDSVAIVEGTGTFADKNSGSNIAVAVAGYSISGPSAPNYQLMAQPSGLYANISPLLLIVNVDNATKIAGQPNPVFTLTYSGFIPTEDTTILDSKPTTTCSATELSPAGSYPITVTGGSDINYTFMRYSGILMVSPATSGCSHSAIITNTHPAKLCPGDSVELTANTGIGYAYQWFSNDTLIPGATDSKYVCGTEGYCHVEITANGCKAKSSPAVILFYPQTKTPKLIETGQILPCNGGGSETISTELVYVSYLWSTGSDSSAIIINESGDYFVTVKDVNGCQAKSDTLKVNTSLGVRPSICEVTVGPESGKNVIFWNREATGNIREYYIYKEGKTNVFDPLDTVQYKDFNYYIDLASDPKAMSNRYRISALDTCGAKTPMSTIHKTMHLNLNLRFGGGINLQWEGYEGIPVTNYTILHGDDPAALTVLKNDISAFNTSYSILDSLKTYYQVAINLPVNCLANELLKIDTGPYAQSLSNIVEFKESNLTAINSIKASVYPNPFVSVFTLRYKLETSEDVTIEIYNELGILEFNSVLPSQQTGVHEIRLNASDCNLAGGIHFIKIIAGDHVSILKANRL